MDTIEHRGWEIFYEFGAIAYRHKDWDGTPTEPDPRYGWANSIEGAKAAIDEHEDDLAAGIWS
jgi:hypothetical protein